MKGKSIDKRKQATPVILIDESEQLTNTIIINKMIDKGENSSLKPSSNVFGGGFKYRPEDPKIGNNISKVNPSKFQNVSKIDKMTVYDQFGLINDSIGKKKYREDKKEVQRENPFESTIKSVNTMNPWTKENKNIVTNNFVDPGYYEISKLKERQQSAIHVKSSLQVINLENIEAKLQAHRQSIKPIEEQYNILKGKSTIQQQPREKLRFNVDIDKEYNEIKPTKIYQLIKDTQQKQERPKEDVLMEDLWEEKKRNDPKLAEYDFKYQQYLVQKEAKKLIGSVVKDSLFTWDKYAIKQDIDKRKIAKQHKSKEKSYGQAVESKVIEKAYNKSVSPTKEQTQSPQSYDKVNIEDRIASKDDKFIGKFVMAQIDVDKRGMISKDELVDYLMTKEHLIKGYHIDLKWLHTDLDNFQTKRKGMLNQNEVIQFLATLDALHHPQMVLKEIGKEKSKKEIVIEAKENNKVYTSYYKENAIRFQRVFSMLDFNEDKIIKRQEFIENIFIDADCSKILDKNVIVFNVIDKSITFRQIISFILDDYRKEKNQKLKKSKEYITLERFNEYFEVPQSLDLTSIDKKTNQKIKESSSSHQIEIFDIEQEYLLILKDIFDTIPRIYQDYIVVNDFINIAMKDPQILAIEDQMCRIQSVQTKIPVETIKSTLMRMRKQCDEYGTWDIIKTYFTRRGRPLDWDLQLIQKKKEIRQEKFKEKSSTIKNASIMQQQMSTSKPTFELSGKSNKERINSIQKYTIPKPFNITDQIKKKDNSTKLLSTQQQEIEELKKKFKAKPLNAEILQPKPELIQGKLGKSQEKSVTYNYQNYQNDRIERLLKKAQEQFEEQERMKEIKRMAEVKAKEVKIDLNKRLDDVVKQQKKAKEKTKPKPTVPQVSPNLYPENPKQEAKKKLEKYKTKLEKEEQAAQLKQNLKNEVKQRAKDRNEQIKETAKQKKKKEEQQKQELAKLSDNSYKPKINKSTTTQEQKQALRKAREERQRKKLQQQTAILQALQKKKREKLSYIKHEVKLQIQSMEDEEILNKLDQVDLEDLLLNQQDRSQFRKQFQLKNKTRKQIKERFNGQAGRQRAAMQAEQKRLADEKKQLKEKKQSKIIKEKIEQAKELKNEVTTTMNIDTNFHRSNALRRYRALMEGKEPNSQYDQYSRVGDAQRNDDI